MTLFERLTGWRWHVTMSRTNGEVYMDRWQLLKTRLLCIYVNHIRLPDEDPMPHNHPWLTSWSVKLRGWYKEETFRRCEYGRRLRIWELRRPGRVSRIPDMHRIVELSPGGAWTLFIGWRSERPWGFIDETGRVIPWKERAKQRGLPARAFSGGQNAPKA
jgi:hypothetical protein